MRVNCSDWLTHIQGRAEVGREIETDAWRRITNPVRSGVNSDNAYIFWMMLVGVRGRVVVHLADQIDRNEIPVIGRATNPKLVVRAEGIGIDVESVVNA